MQEGRRPLVPDLRVCWLDYLYLCEDSLALGRHFVLDSFKGQGAGSGWSFGPRVHTGRAGRHLISRSEDPSLSSFPQWYETKETTHNRSLGVKDTHQGVIQHKQQVHKGKRYERM